MLAGNRPARFGARRMVGLLAAGLLLLPALSPPAAAESINAAMASAYLGNPTLRAERARQRATDELVPQQLSGWRPTVVAGAEHASQWQKTSGLPAQDTDPTTFTVQLSQPLFRGGQTVNGVRSAEATVEAGRQALLTVEQQVLLDAATAYMNVIRDRSIVDLRKKQVEVLTEQLKASQARFDVGEITRTDVEQSKASLSLAKSALSSAQANLAVNVAFYVRVIGHAPPAKLETPKVNGLMPKTLDGALKAADAVNPTILAAAYVEEASRFNIDVVRGVLLPSASFEAQYTYVDHPMNGVDHAEQGSVAGVLTVPIYQSGLVYSQLREAKQVASQRRIEILEARRAVRELVTASWNIHIAAKEVIVSAGDQVAANQLALEGVRQEAQVGSRTTLDVLDAEQTYVDSQVQLVTARRDEVVAAYVLLNAIGRMTAEALKLRVPIYDPLENYMQVRDKAFGAQVQTVQ